jgi:hypothetical protein
MLVTTNLLTIGDIRPVPDNKETAQMAVDEIHNNDPLTHWPHLVRTLAFHSAVKIVKHGIVARGEKLHELGEQGLHLGDVIRMLAGTKSRTQELNEPLNVGDDPLRSRKLPSDWRVITHTPTRYV